jgi:hypothetical protein
LFITLILTCHETNASRHLNILTEEDEDEEKEKAVVEKEEEEEEECY